MSGEKMAQAREAALGVVEQLNSQDRFNIIAFSTGTRSFNNSLLPVEEAGNYRSFINGLDAVGGTNISQALLEAVGQVKDDRPTTVIFLTDGLATEGIVDTELLLDSVAQQSPNNVRIFAFGVGDDVDTLLLDTLTGNHGGTTTYVRPGQSIEEAVSSFYAKVSMPVLADIELDFDDIIVEQMFPQELPDLFAGSQLLLAGRYREGGPATITLSGEVNGDRRSFTYEDNIFRNSGGDDFIPRLWATRAIGHLLTQIRLHGEDEELVQSIVNLSLRYGIITPYTSYLIEEDDIFTQTGREELIEESMDVFSEPAEASGAAAVDKAADERFYAEAEAPIEFFEAPSLSGEGQLGNTEDIVKFVGSKTFVFQDGLWIDTIYDANGNDPQQVGFASDAYFELLSAVPQLGQYLSLGQRVLVVHQGIAYEIVEGEGSGAVTIPVEIDSGDPDPDLPSGNDPVLIVDNDSDDEGNEAQEVSSGICGLALAAPTFAVAIFIIGKKRWL
jgi:Ca-activated chloride channel family protein